MFVRKDLVQKQIGLPAFFTSTDKMLYEKQMAWPAGLTEEGHVSLFRCTMSLFIVADNTGANKILPAI